MDQVRITEMIDSALIDFRGRDLISGSEILDFLLDLRIAATEDSDAALERLLAVEAPATPTF